MLHVGNMNSPRKENDSVSSAAEPPTSEGRQSLLPYRYEGSSHDQDYSFDGLPDQRPFNVYDDCINLRSCRLQRLKVSARLNTILLLLIIVSSTVYFSLMQARLSKILTKQPVNQSSTSTATHTVDRVWKVDNFSSLVVFGDSYSAEVELGYFIDHLEHQEKVEWKSRVNSETAVGGFVWPRWVAWYTGVKVFNYAVGGAVCSTRITPHNGALGVHEHELASFLADVAQTDGSASPMLDTPSESTVYAIFLGANDLGNGGFLTQDQVSGKTLDDWVRCVFEAIDRIHRAGGRNFVIMNAVPLHRSPTFNSVENGGVVKGVYWPDKPKDSKPAALHMEEIVASVNYALRYQAAYEMEISKRYAHAKLAYFDVHRLFSDVIDDPERFLNGTASPDATGSCISCKTGDCNTCTSRDSYLWFDELHPSEQASRIVAKELKMIIGGSGSYAEYWES